VSGKKQKYSVTVYVVPYTNLNPYGGIPQVKETLSTLIY
jgi:hypothetical protein